MSFKKALTFILVILVLDQASKFYIKTHFHLQEELEVFSWFKLVFIENDGMAWGATLNDFLPFLSQRTAKVCLTLFRIIALIGIGYWLIEALKNKRSRLLILCISLIFAGALGNIIDSTFYSILFNDSYNQIATFLPKSGGYDTLLHGKVVDMLHFPLYKDYLPEWMPFVGGTKFTFFEPVFNIADVAISIGFIILLVFNKRVFKRS